MNVGPEPGISEVPPHPGRTGVAHPPAGPRVEERPGSSPRNARESMPPAGHGGELAPQIAPHIWVDPTREQVSRPNHTTLWAVQNPIA